MPPVGFEPTISAGERPQTYALDRAATGPDTVINYIIVFIAFIIINRNLLYFQLPTKQEKDFFTLFL